jgi:hypothetical protein
VTSIIVGIKMLYLVNLSIILLNLLNWGSSGRKSIEATLKGWEGMGIGYDNLAGA